MNAPIWTKTSFANAPYGALCRYPGTGTYFTIIDKSRRGENDLMDGAIAIWNKETTCDARQSLCAHIAYDADCPDEIEVALWPESFLEGSR